MRTFEMLIVFSALMAIIALVAIALDWVGKPLRGRLFVPRLYRYDDEILPPAESPPASVWGGSGPPVVPVPPAHVPPAHVPPAHVPPAHVNVPPVPVANTAAVVQTHVAPALSAPTQTEVAAAASTFSDQVGAPPVHVSSEVPPTCGAATPEQDLEPPPRHHRPFGSDGSAVEPQLHKWSPGMALDARVDDRKPTLAVKAERFWQTAARSMTISHFDDDDRARMGAGKAPRRHNPRTGQLETMQLVGLRQASQESAVRMRWPDDAVDPWSAQ